MLKRKNHRSGQPEGHRVKYGLNYFFGLFVEHFLDHFKGGKYTISTEGGVK